MNKDILSVFFNIPYFSMESFRQVASLGPTEGVQARIMINRWIKAGHLLPLKKGEYMTRHFYELHRVEPMFLPAVSAILKPMSYISLEFILQRGGILTEATYPVTAVTLKNTHILENPLGSFIYKHIRSELYIGFMIQEAYGIPTAEATPAKALFDFLYLRPLGSMIGSKRYNLAEDLRLNLDSFTTRQQDEFARFVDLSLSRKMRNILANLRRTIWQP